MNALKKNMISVDKAISVGQRLINLPILISIITAPTSCIILSVLEVLPYWSTLVGLAISFAFSWLYWSLMIPKWKVWAFSNVRNVHELKQRAINGYLIWPDGNSYEKNEIWSKADRKKWELIQEKFKEKDVFEDDMSIPSKTIIRTYITNYSAGFYAFVIFVGGVYWAYKIEFYEVLVFTTIVSYVAWVMSREEPIRNPEILINDKGVGLSSGKFYSWSEIKNEQILEERFLDSIYFYLTFEHDEGKEKVSVDNLDVLPSHIMKLFAIYRGRHDQLAQ